MKRLISCLLLAAALPLVAQISLDSKNREGQPILINSDAMNVDLEKGIATFYGNVIVNDPDVLITCKKMVLYQEPKNKTKDKKQKELKKKKKSEKKSKKKDSKDPFDSENSKLERIECIDNVVITRKNTEGKNQWGTCGKAIYFHKEGSITMSIDPVLYQDDSKITGIRLTFFRDSKQIEGTDIKITARNLGEEEKDPKNPNNKDDKKKSENKDADSVDEFYKKNNNSESENNNADSEKQTTEPVRKKLSQKEADALLGLDKVPEKDKFSKEARFYYNFPLLFLKARHRP